MINSFTNLYYLGVFKLFSGDTGADFLNDNIAGKQLFRQRIDAVWNNYIGGSAVWIQIVNLSAIIGFVYLLWNLFDLMNQAIAEERINQIIHRIVVICVVLVFLSNNGALAATLGKANRDFIFLLDQGVSQGLQLDNQYNQKFRDLVGKSQARGILQSANAECADNALIDPAAYQQCMADYFTKIEAKINPSPENQSFLDEIKIFTQKAISGNLDTATYVGQQVVFANDRFKLFIAGISYRLAADVALIASTLFLPLALAGALMPNGEKSIFGWFSVTYGIGMSIISFTLAVSIVSSILTSGDGIDDAVLAFLLGKAIPIFSSAMGLGGAWILFSTLSGAGLNAASQSGFSRTAKSILGR